MATCKICNLTHFAEIELQDDICLSCEGIAFDQRHPDYHVHLSLRPVGTPILLTTETSPDLGIQERLDIVTAECAFGHNLFSDLFTQSRHIYGGRTESSRNALRKARRFVLSELRHEAAEAGATAVIGVQIQYIDTGDHHSRMLMLIASGTAVLLGPQVAMELLPPKL